MGRKETVKKEQGSTSKGERGKNRQRYREREKGLGYRRRREKKRGRSEFLSSLPLDSIQLNFEITP